MGRILGVFSISLVSSVLLFGLASTGCSDDSDSDAQGSGGALNGSGGTAEQGGGGNEGGAAGNGTGGGEGGAAGGEGGAGGAVTITDCESLHAGLNTGFVVDGVSREFILTLPQDVDSGGPWPVVFGWHGVGDNANDFNGILEGHVDNDTFPFINVTPEDSGYEMAGLTIDWDVMQVDPDTNREGRLFDEIVACLAEKYSIDDNHIHSFGFSMGGIVNDMLGVIRGDKIASFATYSGAYFSNTDNIALLPETYSQIIIWPDFTHDAHYTQLLIHGGVDDTYDGFPGVTAHFDAFAANDAPYLNAKGHDVILCDHGEGHNAPVEGIAQDQFLEFFKDHPKGTVDSPYATALPSDYPDFCAFNAKAGE